ncbi:acetyl- synthetase [Chlorella sorokiniana]|uniref:Acetyl-synthetase n=1 Tax=Chlorella sorokiniana TaxID=3076 RepID=A0A2P6U1E3_CHLSO|nr:acetyl- synthetase [Chlorella sorokiniana]|eukprot:PRW60134.1 acetyl- synthetase [Chlorella sorokiniana]
MCRSAVPFTPTGAKTLYDNWGEAVERYGPLPCLGRRSGTTYSYLSFSACNRNTVYCVPLYDVLGDNTVEYIIEHSESSIVFVAADKLPVLAKALTKVNLPRVKTIVYWGEPSGLALQALQGVLLTHRAVASEVQSLGGWMTGQGYGADDEKTPHHDVCVEETFLTNGKAIAYWSGEAKGIPADIRACQPAIFCSVPRVLERFEITIASFLLDPLVFREISRQMLGDRIRLVTSGGAPLAQHIEDFMRGYGLTETCAATFVSAPNTPSQLYTVGPPQPAFALRLEAVPDMDYDPLGNPQRGEVLVKGEGLFSGYYKDEASCNLDETRKAIDSDGWFHTGDVGELTLGGALRIIDRKKNIFKLSQGEYIAVEKIENVLDDCPLVDQIWVHGSRFESCLVAVVVPSKRRLEAWVQEQGANGIADMSFDELCRDSQVRRMLQKELEATGKRGGLKSFELPKSIHVACECFTVDNELMTPTFELRRTQLLRKYEPQIEAMYEEMRHKAEKNSKHA